MSTSLRQYPRYVVEARNQKGELFGFQRSQDLSALAAEEIANAAAAFGQEDDITVVVIERKLALFRVA